MIIFHSFIIINYIDMNKHQHFLTSVYVPEGATHLNQITIEWDINEVSGNGCSFYDGKNSWCNLTNAITVTDLSLNW